MIFMARHREFPFCNLEITPFGQTNSRKFPFQNDIKVFAYFSVVKLYVCLKTHKCCRFIVIKYIIDP